MFTGNSSVTCRVLRGFLFYFVRECVGYFVVTCFSIYLFPVIFVFKGLYMLLCFMVLLGFGGLII